MTKSISYARDEGCCLDPSCLTIDCPEPVCAKEYPGGLQSFLRDRATKAAALEANDVGEMSILLGISHSQAEKRLNKLRR